MNRVITINLHGNAYQLEEGGYETLRTYLDNAARRLEGNPDRDEIIADIEQAIAEKFRSLLGANKTVVITREVNEVITAMGPVEDASATGQSANGAPGEGVAGSANASANAAAAEPASGSNIPRRLYRIYPDGAMIGGVCNGLAAYFNVDATIIRLLFVLTCFLWGTGILAYVLMVIIVPRARTPEEKSAATGMAATAQEFIRRAKAGYYGGMRTLHNRQAHREWRRKFKQEMRNWRYDFHHQMQQNAQAWQQHWTAPGAQHPRYWAGTPFTMELLRWVQFLVLALAIYAIYTLKEHSRVFGISVPADFPFWIGVILIIIAFKFVTWPIKAMRHNYCVGGLPCACGAGPFAGLIWLGFLALAVWCLDRGVPQFHEALKQIPPVLHQGIDSIQKWLERA